MTDTETGTRTAIDAAATWHAQLESPTWTGRGSARGSRPMPSIAAPMTRSRCSMRRSPRRRRRSPRGCRRTTLIPSRLAAAMRPARWRLAALGGGGALAAGLALLLVVPSAETAAQIYTTGRSETRAVTLADGSRMQIDRGSRVTVSGARSPVIEIVQGAASFAVRHDPSRVLTVRAGGYDVRDIGTRFDVVSAHGRVAVTVAQGMVGVTPIGGASADMTTLHAGQALDITTATQIAARRSIDPARVADWADGRLEYDGAPLALVAADISRYADRPLMVDPSAADLRFSGVLTIGDGSRLVDQLRAVLPIRARAVGGVVHLDARGGG
ncbi:FecR domain-containing protein [Sphingomonas aerolata]|uniref:FecR family protein n=1 Tax=Sphingomonas aerolata TaxID=185951 RepID=UPI002FE11B54